jgi:hypothetical protein
MTTDLLGFGTNASNVIITRPGDTRVFGNVDTYAKDCSTPAAGDGTAISAAWGVGLMQQLRALIRGNGQTAGLTNIVTEDNTDDAMALKSVQNLIQRGQPRFAVDNGAADALVVALTPALLEYKAGVSIKVLVAHDGTGAAATIIVNGLPPKSILRKGGAPLQPKDLPAGGIVTLECDGTQFQLADMPANFSSAAAIIRSSAILNLTLIQRSIALLRSAAPAVQAINIPAGAVNGKEFVITDVFGNLQQFPATVTPLGVGETIAGAANYVMNRNFQETIFRLYDDGTTRIWSRST